MPASIKGYDRKNGNEAKYNTQGSKKVEFAHRRKKYERTKEVKND